MNFPYALYIGVVSCIILYTLLSEKLESSRHTTTQKKYTSLLIPMFFDAPSHNKPASKVYYIFKKRDILLQTIHTLVCHTYGCSNNTVKQIVKSNHLLQYIMCRLRTASTRKKCELLSQLSSIISADLQEITLLNKLIHSDNHNLRISALIALLAAEPLKAMSILSALEFKLQPLDIMRIMALIRQGRITIALGPLFESRNHNLLMLSMALVRTFGISIVDKHLYNIVKNEQDTDLVCDAIYTLTYLKRPLCHKVIKECIASMSEAQRKRLCRHLSVEGYSMQSINAILSPPEALYAKQLITSFKRQLSQAI